MGLFKRWYYLGYNQKTFARCKGAVLRYNLSTLRTVCLIAFLLMTLSSLVPVFMERKLPKALVYFGAAAIELLVFFFAKRQLKKEAPSDTAFLFGFFVYYCALLAFGLYIGVLDSPGYAVNFIIYLACAQIFYVIPPLRNLLTNVVALGVFIASVVLYRPQEYWAFNFVNAAISMLYNGIFGWYISHILLKETLSTLQLEEERNHFRAESEKDALTGLNNRRFFFETAPYYLDAWQRAHKRICMIMLDLDFFKEYNDTYGHPMGDAALRAVGGVLKRAGEQGGVYAARVGGEEFAVVLAENRSREVDGFALRLLGEIRALQIEHTQSKTAPVVTASIGLYFFHGTQTSIEALYRNADDALYEAKRRGRNCIVRADSDSNGYTLVA